MAKEMNFKKRLKAPTPPFFVQLRKYVTWAGIALAGAGLELTRLPEQIGASNIDLSALKTVGVVLMATGGTLTILGRILTSLPVDDNS